MKANKYRSVRARFVERGASLRRFAISRGYAVSTVYAAASGARNSAKAKRIRAELEEAACG